MITTNGSAGATFQEAEARLMSDDVEPIRTYVPGGSNIRSRSFRFEDEIAKK